ncbi:hypothetical protein DFS34DRAFT_652996 [Phlyctochytrium arcticum]|nr:hypothetical protein DFS34DRAFT_652996 [Phlyctochytrium arcticum]
MPVQKLATGSVLTKPPTRTYAMLKSLTDIVMDWAVVPFLNGFFMGALNSVWRRTWSARKYARGGPPSTTKPGVVAEMAREAVA